MAQLEHIEAIEKRLWNAADTLTDFQQHYEKIVSEYNHEKNRVVIEKTFEDLFNLYQDLNEEEERAMREGLSEETLAVFDLLKKPTLSLSEIKRIKAIVVELLTILKEEKLKVDHWREKESAQDAVELAIRDFLWSEKKGLPVDSYTEEDVNVKAEEVYRHVFRAYPTVPSPFYGEVA